MGVSHISGVGEELTTGDVLTNRLVAEKLFQNLAGSLVREILFWSGIHDSKFGQAMEDVCQIILKR